MRRLQRHSQRRHEESHGIDLAPMLDFVLNLLIFFIITAVFVKEAGLRVERHGGGAAGSTAGKSAGSISVVINRSGEILVDGRIVDVRAVRANVERMHAVKPENGVMVVADKTVNSGLLVEVLDQVRLGGVTDISFGATK